MDAARQIIERLFHEFTHGKLAVLVARRHDFDDRYSAAEMVLDNDPICPFTVYFSIRLAYDSRHRPLKCLGSLAVAGIRPWRLPSAFHGEHIRFKGIHTLFYQ